MSNPLIRSEDYFVLLEPDSKEKIVSKKEAILWLKNWLLKADSSTIYQKKDYTKEGFFEELLESTYELEIRFGFIIKWFAVRVDQN